ncbi:3-deoxy-manno-octulosonate cytidylyltransferase [bacterium]|nr:3-deoxy-manno-octulosonate cytidylyltransferase [bacterium]
MNRSVVLGVIPARYASTRLPGKPLADIAGKPMVVRVVEQALRSELLNDVIVATDDIRILSAVQEHGYQAMLTSVECVSGTDRVAEIAKIKDADIVVNIQGDEPFISPDSIDKAIRLLLDDDKLLMGTLACRISDTDVLFSPDTVKVVMDTHGNALYFSRSPVPFCRDIIDKSEWLDDNQYYQHIGLYVYSSRFLAEYTTWPQSSLEKTEKLEQLRVLQNGIRIKIAEISETPLSVDTPEDLQSARIEAAIIENRKEGFVEA